MTLVKDDKEFKEEPVVQVLSDDDSEVEEAKDGGEKATGDDNEKFDGEGEAKEEKEDDDDVKVLESLAEEDEDEEDGDGDEDDDDDDDDDGDDEDDEEKEDLGTEYLVRPVGEVEDEDDASDFDPEENGVEEDVDEEIEEEDVDEDISLSAGKSEPLPKRKRVAKDHNEQGDVTADDIRPSKR